MNRARVARPVPGPTLARDGAGPRKALAAAAFRSVQVTRSDPAPRFPGDVAKLLGKCAPEMSNCNLSYVRRKNDPRDDCSARVVNGIKDRNSARPFPVLRFISDGRKDSAVSTAAGKVSASSDSGPGTISSHRNESALFRKSLRHRGNASRSPLHISFVTFNMFPSFSAGDNKTSKVARVPNEPPW